MSSLNLLLDAQSFHSLNTARGTAVRHMAGGRTNGTCVRGLSYLVPPRIATGPGPSRLPAVTVDQNVTSVARFGAHTRHCTATIRSSQSKLRAFPARGFSATTRGLQDSSTSPNIPVHQELLVEGEGDDAGPTLEHLDSLHPHNTRPSVRSHDNEVTQTREWNKTHALIMKSFSHRQLSKLARQANVVRGKSRDKVSIINRIMVQRFGMQDLPGKKLLAKLSRQSASAELQPHEFFLLVSRGLHKVRQVAHQAGVTIAPKRSSRTGSTGPAVYEIVITGKKDNIGLMLQWIETFKQSIRVRQESLALLNSDSPGATASQYIPAELSQTISRLSKCFLTVGAIENERLSLSLSYVDSQDVERAMLMLRQVQTSILQPSDKVGAAAHTSNLDTLRQYAMLPFVSTKSPNWVEQAEDVLTLASPDLSFRVSHVPDHAAYSLFSTSSLTDMKLTGWQSADSIDFDEPFEQLAALTTQRFEKRQSLGVFHRATLGHVLFTGNAITFAEETESEAELVRKLQDPLAVPRPGQWPMEHVVNWARSFRTRWNKEASRFAPTTFFRSVVENVLVQVWLGRHGWTPTKTVENAEREIVLTYQHDTADSNTKPQLEISLRADREWTSSKWHLERTRWVSDVQAPVMVPERSVDIQLSSLTWMGVGRSDRNQIGDLMQAYRSTLMDQAEFVAGHVADLPPDMAADPEFSLGPAARSFPLPPAQLDLDGLPTLTLVKAERKLLQAYVKGSNNNVAQTEQQTEDSAASAPDNNEEEGIAADTPGLRLVRETVQDALTHEITESLSLVWRAESSAHAPKWRSVVHDISSLIDKHDTTIRPR